MAGCTGLVNNDTDTILRLDGTSSGFIYLRCVGSQL